jgi:ribonuclease E
MSESAPPGKTGSQAHPDRPANTAEAQDRAQSPGGDRDSAASESSGASEGTKTNKRRRGSRGGRNRNRRPDDSAGSQSDAGSGQAEAGQAQRKPQIGDTRPAPAPTQGETGSGKPSARGDGGGQREGGGGSGKSRRRRGRRGRGGGGSKRPVEAVTSDAPIDLDEDTLELRRGRERKGQPVGRYTMVVHAGNGATQIAVLQGRALIEFYVSRPADDVSEIHGNVYLGKVQNVLPGMEAAFVDIGTPKNAVLYRGDVTFDKDDVDTSQGAPRIEQVLKNRQTIMCQVTKNPIAHKGARLTQEVSLPGRFVVLVPNSNTYGISKRLPDKERKRLRQILDRAKPAEHGVIVRTAAENITAEEIERDVARLVKQWEGIEALAKSSKSPSLLYREPEMAMRVIREEFSKDYRSVVVDDRQLFDEVNDYVSSITPALADRVVYHDRDSEALPLFEKYHVHEQLVKALDRKVWLPSGGSLIIEHTEALTVIDVNTGKNVGSSSLEETVYRNNLEAAKEAARQLRLRDIGGIIVIDFVDMEVRKNRDAVIRTFREALAHDKTRTQVFDISELGLVEMTRKRIGEGLLESFAKTCEHCNGLGHELDKELLELPVSG